MQASSKAMAHRVKYRKMDNDNLQRREALCPTSSAVAESSPANITPTSTAVAESYGPLPCTVGQANCRISTWALGKDARELEVGRKLKNAPFDCVVIILSTAVAGSDAISKYINRLARTGTDGPDYYDLVEATLERGLLVEATLAAKAVYRLSHRAFAVINRATVADCSRLLRG